MTDTTTFTGEVHPAAELWPRLNEDEFASLVESIERDGLAIPLVMTPDGVLLDGRNRLAACEVAGVTPSFLVHEGDPVAFVLAANAERRHVSKGQKAMLVAQTVLLSNTAIPRGDTSAGVSQPYVSKASTVLKHAPDLAEHVAAGTWLLPAAYDEAKRRKADGQAEATKLVALEENAPKLAEQVHAGNLSVSEAFAALHEREAEEVRQSKQRQQILQNVLGGLDLHIGLLHTESFGAELQGYTAEQFEQYAELIAELNEERIKHVES